MKSSLKILCLIFLLSFSHFLLQLFIISFHFFPYYSFYFLFFSFISLLFIYFSHLFPLVSYFLFLPSSPISPQYFSNFFRNCIFQSTLQQYDESQIITCTDSNLLGSVFLLFRQQVTVALAATGDSTLLHLERRL